MENLLAKALSTGQLKLAKMLIEGGQNVNFCNSSGVTPLMLACSLDVDDKHIQRKLQLVKYILDRKTNLTAVDNIGRTALMYALFSGCKQTIQLIKSHGLVQSVNIPSNTRRAKFRDQELFASVTGDGLTSVFFYV
ncbi:ankyrin repeat domain-containing protein 34A-like [Mytilus edulis]|uniref:ankyrin repeat domain-containing protein 34A-like n=1 Tax=Mytilus edulis TaxID=6550 RepID=UPI0039EF85B3